MLTQAYNEGARAARRKLALAPPTQVDEFVANVESGKDVPLDPSTDVPPTETRPGLMQDPAPSLGMDIGLQAAKAAALGLKDMHFFENMLGPDEARSMFQGIERQMSGKGGGVHGTLEFGPQGKTLIPHPPGAPSAAQRPPGAPSYSPAAAQRVISSARPLPPPTPMAARRR